MGRKQPVKVKPVRVRKEVVERTVSEYQVFNLVEGSWVPNGDPVKSLGRKALMKTLGITSGLKVRAV